MVFRHDKTARIVWTSVIAFWLSGCAMTSHAETFRFEDYRDDKSLREALLRLHPPGSPVEAARETLEKAGASCRLFDSVIASRSTSGELITQPDPTGEKQLACTYSYATGLVRVDLQVTAISAHDGSVIGFVVLSQYTGP